MIRAALLALALVGLGAPARAQRAPPNVILVLADDLGIGELGAYGQERIATPHLDRLAARGARFTAAYAAAPVCAPSRCAILTGLSAPHCSVRENVRPNTPLSLEEPNLGLLFSIAGYRTGFVGKWGLGGELDDGTPFAVFSRPDAVGFDLFAGLLDQERAQAAFPSVMHRGAERVALGGARWIAPVLLEEALAFLRDVPAGQPFFLFFAPTLPHREIRVPPEALRYGERGWPEIEATYASMVSELDDEVGHLLALIEARGLAERTLVVVTSDHGPNTADGHEASFFDGTAGRRGQKRDLYEGGLRVPLLVAGPGVVPGTVETPVALYDLLPTLAEAAGVPVPPALDGRSLAPLLRGDAFARGPLVLHSDEARAGEEPKGVFRVRDGALAMVELRTGASELYDLEADPGETRDLAAERPADVARLRALRERLVAPRRHALPELVVEGVEALEAPAPSDARAVLRLDFEGGDPLASVVARPVLRLTPTGGASVVEGALRLPRSASGEARAHAVIGAHPALSFGASSFTFRARVRLEAGTERATIACARPAGRPARFTDWAILARIGPGDPRLGVVLGDPMVSGRGLAEAERRPVVPFTGTLAIGDEGWHEVEVRFDAEVGELVVALDGRSERLPVPLRIHAPSDGPLVLGACLDEAGRAEGALVGALDGVVLARGLGVPPHAPPRGGRLVARGERELAARFVVRAPATEGVAGRALAVEVTARARRGTVRIEPSSFRLLPGQSREVVVHRSGPPGPLEAGIEVVATDALLGTLALGTPLTISMTGARERGPSTLGAIEGGLLVLVPLVLIFVAARRGPGRRPPGPAPR